MMTTRRRRATLEVLLIAAVTLSCWAAYASAATAAAVSVSGGSRICDTCACTPDNVAPLAVNCTCAKTKLLILRDQDTELLSSARDLTLASCGYVSIPSHPAGGRPRFPALARVTVRDMKLFHYTTGLFPALESLTVEDVGELVLDGFGPAARTLRHLALRRTTVNRVVNGTLTADSPLRSVLLDRVDVDAIEPGALDMAFASVGGNGQADADGFTVVDSQIKSVNTSGVTVRSGAARIVNCTLDELEPGAVVVDDAKGGVWLTGNRLGAIHGDSVSVVRSDADVRVDGNTFDWLPADLELLRPERQQQQQGVRSVEFVDNAVGDVDLSPFLFGVGPDVRVAGNRFPCDCDPRRISVLKFNQVFPGLLPDSDSRIAGLLAENYCREPSGNNINNNNNNNNNNNYYNNNNATFAAAAAKTTTLAGYRDLLVKETVCKGAGTTTTVQPPAPRQPSLFAANRGNRDCGPCTAVAVAVAVALSAFHRHRGALAHSC